MAAENPFVALANSARGSGGGGGGQVVAKPESMRLVVYHQTHFHQNQYISPLPLLSEKSGCTHVIIAAIHLNSTPGDITLNDDPYTAAKLAPLYADINNLKAGGVKVMGMLGGAAKGTFTRLDADSQSQFAAYYEPLARMVRTTGLQGLDLDIEEEMSLSGIVRLILALKADFGEGFIISLAPVATALMQRTRWWDPHRRNLSGFDYFDLEKAVGGRIGWYNCQFYNGWGSLESIEGYERIVQAGWDVSKIVAGVPTSEDVAGSGYVDEEIVCVNAIALMDVYGEGFGGVMGWEYWNSWVADMAEDSSIRMEYWRWAKLIGSAFQSYREELANIK